MYKGDSGRYKENKQKTPEASGLTIGEGYFRKECEVREGMVEEAAALRKKLTKK